MNSPLYSKELRRLDLLALPKNAVAKKVRIAIYRNHSFEIIASIINAFLSASDLEADFTYSSYDDSLNFQVQHADIQVLWLDIDRYTTVKIGDFLADRIACLRQTSLAPVLLLYTGHKVDFNSKFSDVFIFHIDDDLAPLGNRAFDEGKALYSGTRLSGQAMLEMARVLGLKYIPAVLKTSLKAIVIDLDNTLYQGVLGEDGIDALRPNLELQKQLKLLKNMGFFLCISSKNEKDDVIRLFAERKDFLLAWDDFTAVEINWENKADNLRKLANVLNIGLDAMLFIDDNPAEIQNVSNLGIKTLLANKDICQVLTYYPGLLKLRKTAEDDLRANDVKANIKRTQFATELTQAEYFKKLEIMLTYSINQPDQIPRIAELLGKTNQFILMYKRYKVAQIEELMKQHNAVVITIKMEDNLSDSGIIAILVAHKDNNELFLDELTVSCRALGRNLEDIMLPKMFELAANMLDTEDLIYINYAKGERNMPALAWLAKLTNAELADGGVVSYSIPANIDTNGLKIEIIR